MRANWQTKDSKLDVIPVSNGHARAGSPCYGERNRLPLLAPARPPPPPPAGTPPARVGVTFGRWTASVSWPSNVRNSIPCPPSSPPWSSGVGRCRQGPVTSPVVADGLAEAVPPAVVAAPDHRSRPSARRWRNGPSVTIATRSVTERPDPRGLAGPEQDDRVADDGRQVVGQPLGHHPAVADLAPLVAVDDPRLAVAVDVERAVEALPLARRHRPGVSGTNGRRGVGHQHLRPPAGGGALEAGEHVPPPPPAVDLRCPAVHGRPEPVAERRTPGSGRPSGPGPGSCRCRTRRRCSSSPCRWCRTGGRCRSRRRARRTGRGSGSPTRGACGG